MTSQVTTLAAVFLYLVAGNLTCTVISAKWALDLGFSGPRQALWALGGLLFGPLALLDLYLKLRRSSNIPEL